MKYMHKFWITSFYINTFYIIGVFKTLVNRYLQGIRTSSRSRYRTASSKTMIIVYSSIENQGQPKISLREYPLCFSCLKALRSLSLF